MSIHEALWQIHHQNFEAMLGSWLGIYDGITNSNAFEASTADSEEEAQLNLSLAYDHPIRTL
ncbi:hypothetical protein EYZ11_009867 [Aspergillus tanneri]|uniref:Uncharacterized protein n=1 Tax=Aspergillus tanneri TaxID=1220188 RepID=A0A4V3UNC6_9EURO|nr:hypothetical protein EYZ11_009867 [Aspergillus tanneri]